MLYAARDRALSIIGCYERVIGFREGADVATDEDVPSGKLIGMSLTDRKVRWSREIDDDVYARHFRDKLVDVGYAEDVYPQGPDDSEIAVVAGFSADRQKILLGLDLSDGSVAWEHSPLIAASEYRPPIALTLPFARGAVAVYSTIPNSVILDRRSGTVKFQEPAAGRFMMVGNDLYGSNNRWTGIGGQDQILWHVDLTTGKVVSRHKDPFGTSILGIGREVIVCHQVVTEGRKSRLFARSRHDLNQIVWTSDEIEGGIVGTSRFVASDADFFVSSYSPFTVSYSSLRVSFATGRIDSCPTPAKCFYNPMALISKKLYFTDESTIRRHPVDSWAADEWSWEPDMGNYLPRKLDRHLESDVFCA
ncbi:MAG: hypothetical protein V4719_20325, partial [Planctomycetota bacterium]